MIIDYEKYLKYRVEAFPVRHKRKDLYKLNLRINSDCRSKIKEIEEMDRQLDRVILRFSDYKELVQDAHAVNVHWSTKLEGNRMSLEDVMNSSRMVGGSPKKLEAKDPGNQQEILNHLYSYFMEDRFALPWNLGTVSSVHKLLMKGTGEDCIPGQIRKEEEVHVTSNGIETIIGCPAIHVSSELEDLLEWVSYSPYDSLATAVIFFHEFESIHPFVEGNGRTGRSLFHILMQEKGFINFNLCKIDDKLLQKSQIYYSLMEYTDKTGDYSPLVEYFCDCIYAAYEEAIGVFEEKDILKELDESSRALVMEARNHKGWFTLNETGSWVSGLSDQSIRNKLNHLVELGVLEKEGSTRATRYRFTDPFGEIKEMLKKEFPDD